MLHHELNLQYLHIQNNCEGFTRANWTTWNTSDKKCRQKICTTHTCNLDKPHMYSTSKNKKLIGPRQKETKLLHQLGLSTQDTARQARMSSARTSQTRTGHFIASRRNGSPSS